MAETKMNVTTNDNLPDTVSAATKAKIHTQLKHLVEQELAKENLTMGSHAAKPNISIHGSIEIRF